MAEHNKDTCVFCKIILGKIPCYKIHETEDILAFLDINPASEGHVLIVPKDHYENIYDLPEETLKKIISVAKKIAMNYKDKVGINELNLMHASGKNAQQSVFHFHLHLVPRVEGDGLNLWYDESKHKNSDFKAIQNKLKF
jgi:histidine triad (HIT) family protein